MSTEAERWRELDGLLREAMELDAAERGAWLEERCADAELLAEARALLELEERAEEFLETPALVRDPAEIGAFHIVRRVATGGSSVVYEARREGDEHTVALKVLRGSLFVDERRLRQFRREVKTLARLRHPAIARILEAGSTDEGQQYFTMELVRGRRLDVWVEEQAPSLEQRLVLFRAICDAVHHAHEQGVVHRDLKPANVLVGEDGLPKVLDFGLAHLITGDAKRSTSVLAVGEVMGTLPYMSPEQAAGRSREADPRADVYALGVVLYELATGALPFDLSGLRPHEGLNVICSQAPVRPSLQCPGLHPDLETIVLQALQKQPARRYPSAAALSEDVGLLIEDRPILARPPHPLVRLRAAASENKLAVAVLFAIFVALATFSATSWTWNRELRAQHRRALTAEEEARREAARAVAEADKAGAVLDFLNRTLGAAHPDRSRGKDPTVRQVLDEVSQTVDARFADEPAVRAEVHRTLGHSYLSLGRDEQAVRHLSAYVEQQAALDPESTQLLAEGHRRLAEALAKRGRLEESVAALETSLAMQRQLGDEAAVAELAYHLGATLFELGRDAEAEARIAEALELARTLLASEERPVSTLQLVAEIRWRRGELDAAEELMREALAHLLETRGEEHTGTAAVLAALGQLLAERERFQEAQGPLERSLAIRRSLLGPGHTETLATLNNLATLYIQLGRLEVAEAMLVQVLAGWSELGLAEHEDGAITLSNLGAVRSYLGRTEEAEQAFRQALEAYRRAPSNRPEMLASHLANLARAELELGHVDAAAEHAREALELRRGVFGPRHPATAGALELMGEVSLLSGDLARAEEHMRAALEVRRATLPPGHSDLADGEHALAVVLHARGELAAAEDLYRRSLEWYLATWGAEHPGTCLRLACLGELLLEREDPEAAEELLQRALVAAGAAGTQGPDRAVVLQALGRARLALDRHEEAVPLLEEALELRRARADAPGRLAPLLSILGVARLELGDASAAVELLEEALALDVEGGEHGPELDRCELRRQLAKACMALGRPSEAEEWLSVAVAEMESHVAADDPRLERMLRELERVRDLTAEPRVREAGFEREP